MVDLTFRDMHLCDHLQVLQFCPQSGECCGDSCSQFRCIPFQLIARVFHPEGISSLLFSVELDQFDFCDQLAVCADHLWCSFPDRLVLVQDIHDHSIHVYLSFVLLFHFSTFYVRPSSSSVLRVLSLFCIPSLHLT